MWLGSIETARNCVQPSSRWSVGLLGRKKSASLSIPVHEITNINIPGRYHLEKTKSYNHYHITHVNISMFLIVPHCSQSTDYNQSIKAILRWDFWDTQLSLLEDLPADSRTVSDWSVRIAVRNYKFLVLGYYIYTCGVSYPLFFGLKSENLGYSAGNGKNIGFFQKT